MKKYYSGCAVLAFGLFAAVAPQNVTNVASPKGAYDFEPVGDIVWVATSGGLYNYSLSTGAATLRPASPEFPDPSIRALCRDGAGNLWVGTRNGYLMMRDGSGKESVYDAYVSAGWSITDIAASGSFLVIASDKGVSLFDLVKRTVLKNATRIGTLVSPQIYTIYIDGRTLYVGGESGMARCKVPLDSIAYANFYDPSIWQVDTAVAGPVRSFMNTDGDLKAHKGPSANFNGHDLIADSVTIFRPTINADEPIKYGSRVTNITVQKGSCWIGTEEDFFYYWGWGEKDKQHTIPGPTFSGVNRVLVDRSGVLWALAFGNPAETWWLGINAFDGNSWKNYGPREYPEMGNMGGGTTALGVLQTQDGSMWFGYEGGQIKCYNPAAGGWLHYCVYGQTGVGNGAFIKTRGPCPEDWGKCDALAQDSAGYMWISNWNNPAGCLICYKPDPRESNELTIDGARLYRRFPPNGIKDMGINISAITVDRDQHILYGLETGELTIAEKVNNPLTDPVGLRIIKQFNNLSKIYKLVTLEDGSTLAITNSGVYRYEPAVLTLTHLDGFGKNIETFAAENDAIFWYGLKDEGVIVRYDILNNDKTTFTSAHGLVSNQVNDIFIDKKRGNVWIATDMGISRLALGYTASAASKKSVTVFPNPFSRGKHAVVYFRNIPADGSVAIHALNGNLVGTPVRIRKGDGGAAYRWSPPSHLSPGTYFYTVVSPMARTTGKIMLTP